MIRLYEDQEGQLYLSRDDHPVVYEMNALMHASSFAADAAALADDNTGQRTVETLDRVPDEAEEIATYDSATGTVTVRRNEHSGEVLAGRSGAAYLHLHDAQEIDAVLRAVAAAVARLLRRVYPPEVAQRLAPPDDLATLRQGPLAAHLTELAALMVQRGPRDLLEPALRGVEEVVTDPLLGTTEEDEIGATGWLIAVTNAAAHIIHGWPYQHPPA